MDTPDRGPAEHQFHEPISDRMAREDEEGVHLMTTVTDAEIEAAANAYDNARATDTSYYRLGGHQDAMRAALLAAYRDRSASAIADGKTDLLPGGMVPELQQARVENERLRADMHEIASQCHNLPRGATADRIEQIARAYEQSAPALPLCTRVPCQCKETGPRPDLCQMQPWS